MKCPHCLAELKYRERRDKKCPQCRKQFALEPRENALKMSDLRLRGLAERLSHQGTYRYTSAQLAHFAIRRELEPALKNGWVWKEPSTLVAAILFGTVFLIGMSYILFVVAETRSLSAAMTAILFGLVFGLAAAGIYYQTTRSSNSYRRLLPVLETFETTYVSPWTSVHGPLPGQTTGQEIAALRRVPLHPSRVRAVLASPVIAVLDCLRINGLSERLGLALLPTDGPYVEADERTLALLRQNPRLPLLLIHDASVAGCLLPALLPGKWGLAPNHRIVDLGLRPRHVKQRRLPWKREQTPQELIDLLERRAQTPGGPGLDKDELEWLRQGFVTSALFIPPARLVNVVTKAMERLAATPIAAPPRTSAQSVDPEAQAQAAARAVGFMTWPQR
ncbi:MAG: ABC transporter permease [Roseiflexus castenholzii]|uniref:ABC transporter permease n=1 Tax=Roseiflexus castenholzii TaxID=120962 RepID=UPI000CB667A4|nr:MAG: ABC transporter permease [Roseiflexus castenholzii]